MSVYSASAYKHRLNMEWDSPEIKRKPICVCGKVGFDKKSALTKANHLKKRGRERFLRVYPCHMSDYWHLTKRAYYDGEKVE